MTNESNLSLHAALLQGVANIEKLRWLLFPCRPDKTPITKRGFNDATLDSDQHRKWWAKHPVALIGVRTGPESCIFVLDIDVDVANGIDGTIWLREMEAKYGKLPATARARTPRGGIHYYFRYPKDRVIKNSAGKIARGVDVRGDGGYVIAPPSQSPVGAYSWEVSPWEVSNAV